MRAGRQLPECPLCDCDVEHIVCPRASDIGSEAWLREHFPEKDWHRHPRTDGRTDLCDGTPSDCASKVRLP